jgi:hypothetical protein
MVFRGPIGVVILVISAAFGVGFAALRYGMLDSVLPAEIMAALDSVKPASDTGSEPVEVKSNQGAAAVSQDGPGQYLLDGPEGLRAVGPIAAMAGNQPVYIQDVIDGYAMQVGSEAPSELMTIRPISGCKPTPPLQGTKVGHVTAGITDLDLPILTYNDGDLAAAVQAFVNHYRETGTAEVALPQELAYEVYNVAVTETREPVYLVLESYVRNRVWNIHLAPGARVERVILLGGTQSGVANLDPVVPVEVLPAAGLSACSIAPAYPFNRGHRVYEMLASGTDPEKAQAKADIATRETSVTAYNTWFRDSFGVEAETTRAGFDSGMISVVGPQPGAEEPKAVYAPIKGSRIRMTKDSYVEIGGQATEAESFAGRVRAIATSFAFGDLSSLRQGVSF